MFGNLGDMMKLIKDLQENMEKAKEELKKEVIPVEVGGGMVKVKVNALGEVLNIEIDDSLLSPDNKEVLADLLVSAMNEANKRSKEIITEKMSSVAGLPTNLPGLNLNNLP